MRTHHGDGVWPGTVGAAAAAVDAAAAADDDDDCGTCTCNADLKAAPTVPGTTETRIQTSYRDQL